MDVRLLELARSNQRFPGSCRILPTVAYCTFASVMVPGCCRPTIIPLELDGDLTWEYASAYAEDIAHTTIGEMSCEEMCIALGLQEAIVLVIRGNPTIDNCSFVPLDDTSSTDTTGQSVDPEAPAFHVMCSGEVLYYCE